MRWENAKQKQDSGKTVIALVAGKILRVILTHGRTFSILRIVRSVVQTCRKGALRKYKNRIAEYVHNALAGIIMNFASQPNVKVMFVAIGHQRLSRKDDKQWEETMLLVWSCLYVLLLRW